MKHRVSTGGSPRWRPIPLWAIVLLVPALVAGAALWLARLPGWQEGELTAKGILFDPSPLVSWDHQQAAPRVWYLMTATHSERLALAIASTNGATDALSCRGWGNSPHPQQDIHIVSNLIASLHRRAQAVRQGHVFVGEQPENSRIQETVAGEAKVLFVDSQLCPPVPKDFDAAARPPPEASQHELGSQFHLQGSLWLVDPGHRLLLWYPKDTDVRDVRSDLLKVIGR